VVVVVVAQPTLVAQCNSLGRYTSWKWYDYSCNAGVTGGGGGGGFGVMVSSPTTIMLTGRQVVVLPYI